ncbi:SDR family NAD(P)-dependent oxidoreductase [Microbulbifer sp.]|uniref:SDR family NAD(P)-dependent oxidoreductase n=1 Tax=Microbulbifer sp. TaxID=1908541 RepID=UPI002F92A9C1
MTVTQHGASGKTVLVTGASSGIGRAVARRFAQDGWLVMLAGRDQQKLLSLQQELPGSSMHASKLENSAACDALVEVTIGQFGRLDALINCAGIIQRKTAQETDDACWAETMRINLDVPFYLSRGALPYLTQSRGAIVNIASDWGLNAGRNAAAYCASKGGLVMLTKSMALDHAKDGVTINAVCPGDVDTPMLVNEAAQRGVDYQEAMATNNADVPTGRITKPEEVAALCAFLCSDQARQITGTAMLIDGGANA